MTENIFDIEGRQGKWRTLDNGSRVFIRKGETVNDAIARRNKFAMDNGLPNYWDIIRRAERAGVKVQMTPEQKIASVHIEAGKDNILPELNEDDLDKLGVDRNKPVLVKASIIQKNLERHPDVSLEVANSLIGQALYSKNTMVGKGKYADKPYYIFYKKTSIMDKKGNPIYGTVAVDVTAHKGNFEVVHWHWARENDISRIVPSFKQ